MIELFLKFAMPLIVNFLSGFRTLLTFSFKLRVALAATVKLSLNT